VGIGGRYVATVALGQLVFGCGGPPSTGEGDADSVAAPQAGGVDVCRSQPPACARARELGVRFPWSSARTPLVAGELVIVSPNEIVVSDATIAALREGVPGAGEFEGHVSASFAAALAGRSTDGPLTLLADQQTPFSTVADLMFTAHRLGARTEFQLAVVREGVLAGLMLFPAREWTRHS
jgi:hypothetical protein